MSFVARGITGVAGRYVELTARARRERDPARREQHAARRAGRDAPRWPRTAAATSACWACATSTPAETLAARVIAIDASPYFRVARIEIDRGEGTVRRGMPVLTPEGVVGRVNRVAGNSSDIMLLVDPRSAIDVLVPRTGGRGILRGKPGENGYRCSIEYLARGEPAKEGDAVVTSGLGGAFPRDLAGRHRSAASSRARRPLPGGRGHARRRLRAPVRGAGGRGAAAGARSRSRRRSRSARPAAYRCIADAHQPPPSSSPPAADPAVDGAGARADAHGDAQPRACWWCCTWGCRRSGRSRRRRWCRSSPATSSIWCRGRPRGCTPSCSC